MKPGIEDFVWYDLLVTNEGQYCKMTGGFA